jgi:hypothetical protein
VEVAIVYESIFGNTRTVAEAVAEGLHGSRPDAAIFVRAVAQAPYDRVAGADLLVVGGPTHILRMTTARTRRTGLQALSKNSGDEPASPAGDAGATVDGVREWLRNLPAARSGQQAAAFDTRLGSLLAGGAAKTISRRLRDRGYEIMVDPRGFVVEGNEGPLRPGEEQRARLWGVRLARVCSTDWMRGIAGDTGDAAF